MTTATDDHTPVTMQLHHHTDLDASPSHLNSSPQDHFSDPFDIANTKKASIQALRRWREAALVLNASRRFRYTFDLRKAEEKEQRARIIRAHAQVIRAALLFKLAGQRAIVLGTEVAPLPLCGDYEISLEQLTSVTRDHDLSALQQYGGAKGLSEKLKTDIDSGIVDDDVELSKRKNVFGANTYPMRKGRSYLRFLWEAWQDLTLIILIIAAVVSLALGIHIEGLKEGWFDGGSITFAVLLVIFVTATSDYRQSLRFQNLNEEKRNIQVEVIRAGRREKISIYEIVVGDVVPLKIGDQVPADGVLISGHSLAIDESSMTGESKIVNKNQKAPFLMAGCKVADGAGTMLVTGVGINTEWGLLMASISDDTGEETPLQVRLNGVATFIGIVGLAVALFVLIVLLSRFFTGNSKNLDGTTQFVRGQTSVSKTMDGVVHIITAAVTIVVVAVPEGLPLAVTLTLAYSMKKMMADKALVRRLSACETMGSATTICSDKTGTLTLNQMTVVEAYIGETKLNSPEDGSQLHSAVSSLLNEGITQNTSGSVFTSKDGKGIEVSGSPTEKAILSWGVKIGMKFDVVRSESIILHVSPFNSTKKRGGVAVRQRSGSQVHIHWKGAAEIILESCTGYLDSNGCLQSFEREKDFLKEAIGEMAAKSLRCVAIAYQTCNIDEVPTDEEGLAQWVLPEDGLILLAILGIKDPCRPGVKDAVRQCSDSGVKVRMVTGDNIQTARAIALECGILTSNTEDTEFEVIEGKTFRELSEKEQEQVAKRMSVMGRSSPSDKLLLVQTLRKIGEVVAVTGDGTNDAPALHEADIGLSMGIQGTEVAKESSDIIILDDNFASVVKVVRWGRSVYANIQKFIQFQLTVNVAALVINVVAAVSSGDVPLNTVQLLWVNLIMDTLGALALATEPPTDHLMHRPPVGRREPLVTNIMWRNLLIQALYQIGILLVLNFQGKSILHLEHDDPKHAKMVKNTLIFNAFVFCQIFNEVNARKPDEINVFTGVTKNPLFSGVIGTTFVLQIIIIQFLGNFTKTVRLSWQLWMVSLVIGIISWPLAAAGKFIPVPKTPVAIKLYQRCIAARKA
ncbi:Calcium-transporting ATPase 9, plasma membrane-type [Capsicum annuum]|uniref:Calcium-transporting ATPase n=1 Tax=Capsicum annuum TaxID=4072 RepID=A0A2G3A3P1_CAPAN|nr:calcium-transporting ATPase 9, plasma membrane-type [Capsicum annuum]KAF3623805.1 Calcium-transporting ATPase 9, plasma membrane-type [Capsicum annuum]KAF3659251.1 Calcium-transporting ATPase 9, plasma membrane-type [Capsicum annuum]PHT88856.1 Calcium-transporting ATPase 9, plasma membrane-type [Capsicum annuum]